MDDEYLGKWCQKWLLFCGRGCGDDRSFCYFPMMFTKPALIKFGKSGTTSPRKTFGAHECLSLGLKTSHNQQSLIWNSCTSPIQRNDFQPPTIFTNIPAQPVTSHEPPPKSQTAFFHQQLLPLITTSTLPPTASPTHYSLTPPKRKIEVYYPPHHQFFHKQPPSPTPQDTPAQHNTNLPLIHPSGLFLTTGFLHYQGRFLGGGDVLCVCASASYFMCVLG